MKLTYADLRRLNSKAELLNKLVNTPMNTKAAYRVKKIIDGLNVERPKAFERFEESIRKKFEFKDAEGNILKYEPTQEKEYVDALTAFDQTEFQIEQFPLTLADLADLKLSVSDLAALECVLEDQKVNNVTPIRA